MAQCVLVTGGAGYIGSHTVIEVVKAGYDAVIVDNLVNANLECVRRVEEICGRKIPFYNIDMRDLQQLKTVFQKHKISHVMHFAGLKAVGESCQRPLLYYRTNLEAAMNLIEAMDAFGVKNIVFSSSATVYGEPQYLPVDELHPAGQCTNPYGQTKFIQEQILTDVQKADKEWNVVLMRYFNPIGAHPSGRIGEDPCGPPNNLMPYLAQVSVGRRPHLNVFGNDYDTHDGTGVRDYIHVVDLAEGHVAALKKLSEKCGLKIYNLGTGTGYSVFDMVKALEKAAGKEIPCKVAPRRTGDTATLYADPSLAEKELGWKAKLGLDRMCEDVWRWQTNNPRGFENSSDANEKEANGTEH